MVKRFKIDIEEAAAPAKPKVHPMGIHVSHVKTADGPRYKVHAVGHHLADGIKVGEHLSDSELDDATEMGAKIKHVKEEVEQTSIEADFNIVTQLKKSIDAADMKGGADIRFADGTSAFVSSDVALRVAESLLMLKPAARQHIQETVQNSYKHLMAVHGMIK